MDDAARLVADLLGKLSELDHKVCSYRQDMALEFQRHSKRLLNNVPDTVSAHVEEVITNELVNFPSLGPALDLGQSSQRSADDRRGRQGRASPPPILPHTSGPRGSHGTPSPPINGNDTSDSYLSHDREREFTGLFTPSFLPLLDAAQPPKTVPTPNAVLPHSTPRDKDSNLAQESQLNVPTQRPMPARRLTEETLSSVTSDDSVTRFRKSAIRRSSSASTKGTQSPRRVRFDFEGEEVLTTVSPPLSTRISDPLASPPLDDITTPPPIPLQDIIYGKTDAEETGLLGNSPPRPKKISSTERLKAMARTSSEDTSKWTVVGEPLDDDEEEEGLIMSSKRRPAISAVAAQSIPGSTLREKDPKALMPIHGAREDVQKANEGLEFEEDEDEDALLEMTPLSSFKDKKRFSPSVEEVFKAEQEDRASNNIQTTKLQETGSQRDGIHDGQEEDMFKFEDDDNSSTETLGRSEAERSKYIEEEEDEQDQLDLDANSSAEDTPVTLYSTSPAVAIGTPKVPPPTSPTTKQAGASAGSYKGKSFMIGSMRNDEVHKKAAEMGDFSSFVGSVDGRSGVDASDSYRQDTSMFNGTPRSVGERLMEMNLRRLEGSPRRQV
ncbi:hypothetical protein F5Y16DRAFT_18282 [Xylariaceae sp. FL0255]|nr:hypothetical protein F5Y16DRAFT_18282 [Xylariaceae sp. FL0255]